MRRSARNQRRVAALLLCALGVAAITGPWLAPYSLDSINLEFRRQAPSLTHLFGTDDLGRDVFARVLFGARVSLAIGILAAALSVSIGTCVGLLSGFLGRWTDAVLMRVTDAALSVPRLPLLMIAAVILKPSIPLLIVLVATVGWMETARVVRAETISLSTRPFIESAKAVGQTSLAILVRHLLPNVAPTAAVAATLAVGRSILLESALSFFGVGVQPPAASWGNMLYQAQSTMTSEPWLALFPGLAIFLTVWAVNAVGERLATP